MNTHVSVNLSLLSKVTCPSIIKAIFTKMNIYTYPEDILRFLRQLEIKRKGEENQKDAVPSGEGTPVMGRSAYTHHTG
jgi:hypothetical protein